VAGTLLAFSKRYYLFQDPIVIFQVPPCNKTKRAFKFWNSYYFSDCLELLFLSVVLLFIFILYSVQYVSFYIELEKPSWSALLCVSLSLILFHCETPYFNFTLAKTGEGKFHLNILINSFIASFHITLISNNISFSVSLCRF